MSDGEDQQTGNLGDAADDPTGDEQQASDADAFGGNEPSPHEGEEGTPPA